MVVDDCSREIWREKGQVRGMSRWRWKGRASMLETAFTPTEGSETDPYLPMGWSPALPIAFTFMATLNLNNASERFLCVLAEPLGEDFWIAPHQTLRFAVPDDQPMVSWYEDGAAVWINYGDPFDVVVTTETGDVVTCGYQRPPGAFDPPKGP